MNAESSKPNRKEELLSAKVEHVAIDQYDARPVIDAMRAMSFTSRDTARAADIWSMSLEDPDCSTWLTLAGSTSAGGCMHIYRDMVKYGMIDAIVSTGASIIDMDFFEALGFRHYQAQSNVDDRDLRDLYIDRIYDTYIDEEELQKCDAVIYEIANMLEPRPYSSREFIHEMGRYLTEHAVKKGSLVEPEENWTKAVWSGERRAGVPSREMSSSWSMRNARFSTAAHSPDSPCSAANAARRSRSLRSV
jgi:deoxyhypusine synthase